MKPIAVQEVAYHRNGVCGHFAPELREAIEKYEAERSTPVSSSHEAVNAGKEGKDR